MLIQVSRPQTDVKRTFRGVAHFHSLLNELHPQKCQILGFHSEHRASKLLPTWQMMDVLLRLKFLNALTAFTLLLCYLVRSFTAKGMYLKKGRSGFEPEMLVTFSYLVRWPNKEYYNYPSYISDLIWLCMYVTCI